jgi:hypothetical protein
VDDAIVARIEREAGVEGLVELLAERLSPTDVRSLLLAVARRRVAEIEPAEVLRRYENDRLVLPAAADPARLDELERGALDLLPRGFERLELSPVAPLGASAALGRVPQDWVVATTRGGEVVSDSTNVLALECALRRRRDRGADVRLCAVHRVLRAQPFQPPYEQHFRLLALVSAGRAGTEDALLEEQLGFYVRLLEPFGAVEVDREPRKQAYYAGATFGVSAGGLELVEGGFVDWTQRLLGDRKERLLISGTGLDLLSTIEGATRR